jgi:carotenoid cleavage dioxygenase
MRSLRHSPFLEGNFAPVSDERSDETLRIVGTLPAELDGLFLRNGPNPRFAPLGAYHWFDGDGMVHAIRIADGKASYRNRWVRTREHMIEQQAGRALWKGLGEPPDFSNPHGFSKNVSNTSFVFHAGKLLSIWEGGVPYELCPHTLETRGPYTFGGRLKGPLTAHPKRDPETGELFFFGYGPLAPYLRYYVASPEGEIEEAQNIELPRPVMMHDFLITEHYAVFLALPAVLRLDRALQGKSFIHWQPEAGARIGVMPRYGRARELRWYPVPPFFMYHAANAWEEGDKLVFTGGRMPGTFMAADAPSSAEAELLERREVGVMTRFTLDLKSGAFHEQALDDASIGFETASDALLGRKTRFNYASVSRGVRPSEAAEMVAIRKYDLERGGFHTHCFEEGVAGGECVFVAKRAPRSEDDGYLLALTHDAKRDVSALRVIDARRIEAPPLALVELARRVPFGFHARWVDAARLSQAHP